MASCISLKTDFESLPYRAAGIFSSFLQYNTHNRVSAGLMISVCFLYCLSSGLVTVNETEKHAQARADVGRVRLDIVDADAQRADGRHELGKVALVFQLQMHSK